MRRLQTICLAGVSCALMLSAPLAMALDPPPGRIELKRVDLSGAPGMEVVSSITEFRPGEVVALHVHHGVEAGYVVQGAMIQNPGQAPVRLETGTPVLNLRDVVHGGYQVVGDTSLKIFAVHVVDKGQPIYDAPK